MTRWNRSNVRRWVPAVALALAVCAAPGAAEREDGPIEIDAGPLVLRVYYETPARIPELFAYDVWEYRNVEEGYVLVQVQPGEYLELLQSSFRIEIDVERTHEARRTPPVLEGQSNGIGGYPCYRTVEETYQFAQLTVAQNPSLASWIDIGDSWERTTGPGGYDLRVLKLTNSATGGTKPKLIISSSIHAREYAPAELSTRFAEYLINGYGNDADVTWILDNHEVHLLLQANPDGRKQAENGFLWRKNTNTDYCGVTSPFRGADLNRNFPFEWNCCGGAANNQCDELYRGPAASSEPETRAVRDYLIAEFPDWRGPQLTDPAPATATGVYLDNHAFGELVIWPWGFGATVAPNGVALQTLGRKLAESNGYVPKQAINLYVTDGTTIDFGYGELGVASFTFEVGTQFFQDCDAFETTILPRNLEALVYAAKVARAPYLLPAGPDPLDVAGSPSFVHPGEPMTLVATLDDTRFNHIQGTEPTQNIAAAEAYFGAPPWDATAPPAVAMAATDGAFDSGVESVRLDLDTDALAGRQAIYVRGQDTAGNWGVVGAVFVYVADGTEAILSGQLTRADDAQPLVGAVTVEELSLTTGTDGSGFYAIELPVGHWTVRATSEGFVDEVVSDLVVTAGTDVTQDFALSPTPRLLIVDDDDNSPGVSSLYTFALDALGEDYLIWDTANSDNEPDAEHLEAFDVVLWFTGNEVGGAAGPGSAGEAALGEWLDHSGCLLLASQDYHGDRGQTAFMGTYLGLTGVDTSTIPLSAVGQGLFTGFGPYFLSFPYTNGADRLLHDATAMGAISSGSGMTAITKDTAVYRTNLWGFGLEGIPGQSNHQGLLAQWLGWCDALTTIDGDADGVINADDCYAGDPGAWSLPTPARDLRVDRAAVDGFSWIAPLDIGALAVSYDLLRSTTANGFAAATCVESGLSGTVASDAATPTPSAVSYYLVRANNTCGGALGQRSSGLERTAMSCN